MALTLYQPNLSLDTEGPREKWDVCPLAGLLLHHQYGVTPVTVPIDKKVDE